MASGRGTGTPGPCWAFRTPVPCPALLEQLLRTPWAPSQGTPREGHNKRAWRDRVAWTSRGVPYTVPMGEYPVYHPSRYPPTAPPGVTVTTRYPSTDHRDMHFGVDQGDPRGR